MECDLAYRFGISQPTVSILITWINYHIQRSQYMAIKSEVLHFMTPQFKEFYPSTRCIIDATEIFIQSPSDPIAQFIFSYKNHNIFKAFIGITPSGTIPLYLNYGGSISERVDTKIRPS